MPEGSLFTILLNTLQYLKSNQQPNICWAIFNYDRDE